MSIVGIETEIQKAVVARLRGNAPMVAAVAGGFRDEAAQPPVYPWVQVGEATATKDATFTEDCRNVLMRMHVWSRYAGSKQASDIMALMGDLLDEHNLSVSGAVLESCEVEQTQVLRDPDGITRHGVFDLRVRVASA